MNRANMSSSESSDSEPEISPRNTSEPKTNEIIYPNRPKELIRDNGGLTLQEVNELVREYEKQEKRERKSRVDKLSEKQTVTLTPDELSRITLTKKQLNQLKEKKPRSEAQQAHAKRLVEMTKARQAAARAAREAEREAAKQTLDVRTDKSKPGFAVKIAPKQVRRVVKKTATIAEPETDGEEEEEEPEVFKSSRGFQGRKPKVDEEDEVERKMEKLKKLDTVLSATNPFLAQVLASRGIRY